MITPEEFVSTPVGWRVVDELQRRVVLSLSDDWKDWREIDENFRNYLGEVPELLGRMTEGELWQIVVEAAIDIDGGVLCDCPNHECVEFFSVDGSQGMLSKPWSNPWDLDIADAILNSEASSWWSDHWDRREQVCLVEGAPTGRGEFKPRNMALTPDEVNLWTSSVLEDRVSTEEGYIAADSLRGMFEGEFDNWRYYVVNMNPSKPVYEIDSQAAWVELCEYAPVVMPKYQYRGYVEPDWARVAERWSGVHVSVNGLISCLNVEVPTSAGLAMMAHWVYERTAWLEWVVASFEQLPNIPGHTRAPRPPRPPHVQAMIDKRSPLPPPTMLPNDFLSSSGYERADQ